MLGIAFGALLAACSSGGSELDGDPGAARPTPAAYRSRGSAHLLTFRRDRIVATVAIMRFTGADSSQELVDLAKIVDQRLLAVITAPLTPAEPPRVRTPL